jgi:hypothetical protein
MGDGRAEDPPATIVDTGLLNNFVARWFKGLVQFLHRIRTIESHGTKNSSVTSLASTRILPPTHANSSTLITSHQTPKPNDLQHPNACSTLASPPVMTPPSYHYLSQTPQPPQLLTHNQTLPITLPHAPLLPNLQTQMQTIPSPHQITISH